jgi:hypothetical protein
MADKQLSLRQHAEDGFFADDDPLAELARIASFDPQGETRPKPVHLRREPEFNLEDELLKEFEQFEEPARGVPSLDLPVPDVRAEQAVRVDPPILAAAPAFAEPVFEEEPFEEELAEPEDFVAEAAPAVEPEPALLPEPARPSPTLYAVPSPSFEAPVEPARPVAHPVFDLEHEIFKEFAAFDARRAGHASAVEPPVASTAAIEPVAGEPAPAVELQPEHHVEPVAEVRQPAFAPVEPLADDLHEPETHEAHAAYSGYGDDDLTVEAEEPVDASLDMPALEAMEAEVDPVFWHESQGPVLADDKSFAPAAPEEVGEEPMSLAATAGAERWDDELAVEPTAMLEDEAEEHGLEEFAEPLTLSPSVEAMAQPEAATHAVAAPAIEIQPPALLTAAQPEPQVQPIPAASAIAEVQALPVRKDDFGLDALLADVERYPVAAAPSIEPARAAEPVMPAPAEKPVEQAPAPAAVTAAPIAEAAAEPVVTPTVGQPNAAMAGKPSQIHEPFDDGAFELDLTEIELDMLEMEVESVVAPALNEDHIVASASALAGVAKATVEEKPAHVPERSFTPQPAPAEDYSSLPFDPSQITTEDEPVEALADMDVPDAPVIDHDVVLAPAQPDYDIDIDAEMAHIFARPAEVKPARADQQARSGEPVAGAAVTSSVDLDEFERALEEDFRRSLSENRATSTPDRVALTPSSYDEGGRQGSLGRRLTILAASVAGLVLIGGAGVYAYWGSPGRILSTSSEPKIILADKDPVKIQPKDPGGQIVPNQDKVVYDRVSGDDTDITKQDRLLTSNEEPVDVVQRTLMPENLPNDDDDQANAATDTTDTTDPRLLPNGQDKNITTTEKTVSGVSPRKVRTMVVRADGTLVPRDDTDTAVADTAKKDPTPAEQSQERSLDVTPAAEDVPERLAANDAIAKEIQAASADDSKAFVPEVKTPADATDMQATDTAVTETQPVTDDQPAATDDKPVVADTADSRDDKVADTAPVKKEELAAPVTETDDAAADNAAATDTAAASDKADAPAADAARPADQAAIKDAANADVEDMAPIRAVKTTKISANTPIPANRPVDQPVDIVGRVTDQGNVQKTQEVANADPVQQPVDNAQTTATPAGAYVIQIASLPSAAEAQTSYNKLSAKFASVIGGHGVDIRKAAVKNKGTYYRVRIVAGTRQEATELCARYKAAGGSCLVSR